MTVRFDICIEEEEERLDRKRWAFRFNDTKLVLVEYAEESRPTTRHKYRGKVWDSADERSYNSTLKRPESIPPLVLAEAARYIRNNVDLSLYVGWSNADHRLGSIRLNEEPPF